MDNSRLRIATRIHYLLARYLGDGIDVSAMLKRDDYAREVLFVCAASDDPELHALAQAYRAAPAIDASLALRPSGAPLATQHAAAASGFGALSRPAPLASRAEARWYKPSTWFGGLEA
jgi:hypothetical protein